MNKSKSAVTDAGNAPRIKEGDFLIHEDYYGQSEGFADSDEMRSRLEVKVRFVTGPRKGECRWVDLNLVTKVTLPEPMAEKQIAAYEKGGAQ